MCGCPLTCKGFDRAGHVIGAVMCQASKVRR
jgi:hypothetical protein